MPGFSVSGNEAGAGTVPPANLETRRKHRWVFVTLGTANKEILVVLAKASRPQFTFTEAEMHHDQEVAYFAGKQTWDPLELEWYDAEQKPDVSKELWTWLTSVCQINAVTVAIPQEYKKQATLQMTDGQGGSSEDWTLHNCWPQKVNWQDLDYTNSEIARVAATMRFDRAERET